MNGRIEETIGLTALGRGMGQACDQLVQDALAIFAGLPEERQKELMEEQRKSVEQAQVRDAERRRLEARLRAEPNWIDRAAWIAGEMAAVATKRWPHSTAERDPTGVSVGHTLWMLDQLVGRQVGSETKTCRWLGWVQSQFADFSLLTLDQMKQLNLRSKEEAPRVATSKTNPCKDIPLPAGYGQPGEGSAAAELARIRAVVPTSLLYEVDLVEAVASTFQQYVKVAAEATELRKQLAAMPPAPTQSMRAALQGLLDTYVSLHESGDAGNLGIDTDKTVIAARAALNAFPARTAEPHLANLVRRLIDDHDAKRDVNESLKAVRLALLDVVHPEPFQARCQKWLDVVTEGDATDLAERRARFMEEAMELTQSLGMGLIEAIQLAAYVWGRPNGVPSQEYGGAYTTLAVLAQFTKHDLTACGETELERCWDPAVITKIRGKRSRRHGRGPLPGTTALEADLVPGQPIPDTFYAGCGDRVGPR